jgi:hypothetical protein
MSDCPRCGAGYVAGQEYCLECGVRLPGGGLAGVNRDSGRGGWALRTFLALVVALAGTAAAVAATEGGTGGSELVTATGGFASAPDSITLPAPSDTGPAGVVEWPAGEDGWTIALASLPQTEGRRAALVRVRKARKRGLSPVGIIDSSQYASLHPGYWLVFTGVFSTEAEATSALQPAKRFARTAAVRRIVP